MTGRSDGIGQLHDARSFACLPDVAAASSLLAELADAPCPFSPVSDDLPVALYGGGDMGRLARDFLRAVGRDACMVIDRDVARLSTDPSWSDVLLLGPDDVADRQKAELLVAVSLVKLPYVPVERSLRELDFRNIVPFYDLAERFRHVHPLSNGWFAPPLTAADKRNTERVLARWEDDVSRAHHLQFLAWRRLRQEWTFDVEPLPNEDRFFIPEVIDALGEDEIFLDVGAHVGSVTDAFIRRTNGSFRHVVAIEPDPDSRGILIRKLASLIPEPRRAVVLDCAVGEQEDEAVFHHALGYASQLSPTGRLRVRVRPLDALGVTPTFVKLHLEGAELAALKGARRTLSDHRPVVAATVYHNGDGIWKAADWLMQMLPRYRFLFRVHSWCGTGAVVYAIPAERGGA